MVEKTADRDRFDWRLLVYAALCACFVFIPIEICPLDLSLILKLAVVFFLLLGSTALLINAAKRKNRRRFLPILSMLAVFWASSAAIVAYDVKESFPLRTDVRWLVWSNDYKADVLTQPASGNGEFKHIEWDGWGFPGAGETVVYLVFDPRDSLSAASSGHQSGKFKGIPCAVPLVRRLEDDWYTVLYYTDEGWGQCN